MTVTTPRIPAMMGMLGLRHTVAVAATPARTGRVRSRIEIDWAPEASGAPVTAGEVIVTPWARALVLRLPQGGLVWNRPTALTVQRAGTVRRVPVVDLTRLLQLGLLALAAAIAVAAARRPDVEGR